MICFSGTTVCRGIVTGEAFVFSRNTDSRADGAVCGCPADESRLLELAITSAKEKLSLCAEQADTDTVKDIMEVHLMMLEDEDILSYLRDAVQNGATAQQAVDRTERHFSQVFKETQDAYLIARIEDICDVCSCLKFFLSEKQDLPELQKPVVLVADSLLPGDLVALGKENIAGVVMGSGTVFSHTSILLKEMRIPALICKVDGDIRSGMTVVLDGDDGTVCFEPDAGTLAQYLQKMQLRDAQEKISPFCGFPGKLFVNIGDPAEVTDSLLARCDGIGLFRTEYLYIGRSDLPDEEEQYSVYKTILEKANGKSVTVRTFDIGSDKSVDPLSLKEEENPALGFRGLRVYSLYPEVFKTQLKALLRAALHGNLRIMYPMVTARKEIDEIRQMLLQSADELQQRGIPYRIPPQGAMIETPAAALLSDEIAKAVDFFSVGTNDLTQYTQAIDRQDGRLAPFCDQSYRAVLSLIRTTADNAHKNGIPTGICGELASDPAFLQTWCALGIDSLSVSPGVL